MIKTSDAFNDAFASPGRELRARVTIGKNVYDSNDLTSISYDSGAMTGEQFSIGSTYMNSTKITFSHLIEGLKQLDEVLVEFGIVKADGSTEYVKMGTFIVDEKIQMDRNNNSTTIECMDRMVMLGGIYKSKLTYPADIQEVAVEIANMSGVKANETSLARLPKQKINEPIGYSYRDAIGLIAQFAIGFALFDRNGFLDIRSLVDNEFKIDPSQYFLKGLVKNETFFKLNGISCTVVTTSTDENGNETSKTTVLQSGSASGSQIKLANNVMTQDILDQMYETIKYTNYFPFTLNWNGNPAVEAGDWLTLEDIQGNEFKVPNMSYTLTYNGGLTASSKAETSTNSSVTYSYGGSISNSVVEIGGREGAEGNHIYEGTEDDEPLYPKEGDLWYKHVGPDTEEWIYSDGEWKFITSTKPANDAKKAADEAKKEAEEATKKANDAVSKANDAVTNAGFAKDTADNAKSDAADALTKAGDAYKNAGNALTESSQAKKDAADALTKSNDAYTNAGNALTESSQAKKDSAGALSKSTDAVTNANKAIEDAKNALSDVSKLDQTVKTEISNINGQLSQKVSQDIFDQLKGTVTSQGTEINQNKNEIALKADKTTVDTLSGKVSSNSAAININSNNIALKANRTDVDKVAGSVSDLDAELKVQADQISSKVTRNDVTGMLGPYATQTWAQSQINQTANEIKLGVDQIKNDIESLDVINLISNSSFKLGKTGWSGWDPKYIHDPVVETYNSKQYTSVYFGQNKAPYSDLVQDDKIPIKPNTSYILQIKTRSTIKGHAVTYFQEYGSDGEIINDHAFIVNRSTPNYVNNIQKFTTSATAEYGILRIRVYPGDEFKASEVMLTEGTITPKNWQQSPADNSTTAQYTELSSELKIQAGEISIKANQKDVDAVKKTVTDNTSKIDVNTKTILLKANQTTVDQINGTVKQLDAELKIQGDQITSKVSRTDVTGMLSGYATLSWTQSQIKQTADNIQIGVTQLKNDIESLDVINLIPNSSFKLGKTGWSGWDPKYIHDPVIETFHSKEYTAVYFGQNKTPTADLINDKKIPIKPNTSYILQIKTRSTIKGHAVTYFQEYGSDGKIINDHAFIVNRSTPNYVNNVQKFTTGATAEYGILRIRVYPGDEFKASEVMLTEGTIEPKNWHPAPEDNATAEQYTELDAELKIQAGQISLKASQKDVDTIKKTVSDNKTSIDVNTKSIALKANQTTVDQINGTVKQLDAELKIQGDQITSKVSRTDVTGMLSGYATQSWTQSQIKQTADNIQIGVTQLKNDVGSLDVINLIPNSSFKLGKTGWSGWDPKYIHDPVIETFHSKEYTAVYFGQNKTPTADLINEKKIPVKPNTSYVLQIKTMSTIKNHPVTYFQEYGSDGKIINDHAFTINRATPDFVNNVQKFTTGANAEYGIFRIRVYPGDEFKASEVMLTEGTIEPKNWHPAPEDNATVTDFANLEITVKGVQTTVSSKADKSQVTQLANQITSVVGSVANPNLIPNSGRPRDTSYWTASFGNTLTVVNGHSFYENGKTSLFSINNQKSVGVTASTIHVPVKSGSKYTISGIFFAGANVIDANIWFLGRKTGDTADYTIPLEIATKVKFSPAKAEYKQYTFTIPNGINEGYIRIDNNGSSNAPNNSAVYFAELKMEYGEHATPWVYDNSQSQITQLEDNINLRVQKNDVVNQINVSSEGVLIAGNKIHITGLTSIDSAVIKSAMIADISADKITAGTINAANVNLINMNASNITTGTIKGASLSINLLNGNVIFQKGRIYSTTGTIDMNIDQGYISVQNDRAKVMLNNGEFALYKPDGIFVTDATEYLRIYTDSIDSDWTAPIIEAVNDLEIKLKGHSSKVMVNNSLVGMSLTYNNGLPATQIGGGELGVQISGGTDRQGLMIPEAPEIVVGAKDEKGTSGGSGIALKADSVYIDGVYRDTVSYGSNVYVDYKGVLHRTTSASKYKQNIIRNVDLSDSEKLLNIPLARWDDKAEVRLTGTSKRYFGMIAEDLAAAGLEYLVDRGPNGEIEGIEYSKVALLLIPEVKKLRNKIEMLEQQNGGNIT